MLVERERHLDALESERTRKEQLEYLDRKKSKPITVSLKGKSNCG